MGNSIQSPEDVAAYIEQMSTLIDLPLHPDHRPGVVENFYRIQMVARFFLDYPLPDEIEAAARFQP